MEDNQIKINTELKICMDNLKEDVTYIRNKMDKLEEIFVTRKEFGPIQKLVFGLVGAILLAFAYGLIDVVFKK